MGAFIIYICCSVLFAGLIAFYIMLCIMQKSNRAGDSKCDFYKNTKQPMRIRFFTPEERFNDILENPEQYKAKEKKASFYINGRKL